MNLGDDFLSGPELDFEGLDREAQYFVCPPARMVQRGNYTPKALRFRPIYGSIAATTRQSRPDR
jgi:hypothetical protein